LEGLEGDEILYFKYIKVLNPIIFFDFLVTPRFTLGELKIFSTWSGLEQGYPATYLDRKG